MAPTPPIDGGPKPVEPTTRDLIAASRKGQSPLVWAVVACVLLGSSAVVRGVQDRRHSAESNYSEDCPFPLDQIPRTLGRWTNTVDEKKLDSQTMLITGGKEHIIRVYSDDLTGVRLVVLILFGPVEPVMPHTPQVCYPSNGFRQFDDVMDRTISYSYADATGKEIKDQKASFRSAVYQKTRLMESVYHSFRFNERWSPDINGGRKLPRRNPGVFKVQVQRLFVQGESRDLDKHADPIESFLAALVPAMEHEISVGRAKAATKSVAAK